MTSTDSDIIQTKISLSKMLQYITIFHLKEKRNIRGLLQHNATQWKLRVGNQEHYLILFRASFPVRALVLSRTMFHIFERDKEREEVGGADEGVMCEER